MSKKEWRRQMLSELNKIAKALENKSELIPPSIIDFSKTKIIDWLGDFEVACKNL